MNSPCRYLAKITGCFGLMIFLCLGIGYISASAKSPSNDNYGQPSDGGGKIIVLELATESPKKQLQSHGDLLDQQSPSTHIQLQRTISKRPQQTSSAKKQSRHQASKPVQQPVAKNQTSDFPVPIDITPQPVADQPVETIEIQELTMPEPLMTAATPLAPEPPPQPLIYEDVPASKMADDIRTTSNKLSPEFTPQQEFIEDNLGLITRLLLKFSLVTLCCLSLLFSFSALQIAKSNQRAIYQAGEENGSR